MYILQLNLNALRESSEEKQFLLLTSDENESAWRLSDANYYSVDINKYWIMKTRSLVL